jgi:hypothetical protein
MEQLVEVLYRRHRLGLVDVDGGGRGVVLDVLVDHRYRCRLRGVVLRPELLSWKQNDERRVVAVVARCAGERLKTEAVADPEVLRAGASPTFPCGMCLYRVFKFLVMPDPGAAVLRFTTTR